MENVIHAPTGQQQDFLDHILYARTNTALIARAGCGKTSTILMAVDKLVEINPRNEILICAYNKAIEVEISAKLKKAGHIDWKKVQAQTMHALGWGLIRYTFQLDKQAINENKVRDMIHQTDNQFLIDNDIVIANLVSYAKNNGIGFFNDMLIDDLEVWREMAEHYGIDLAEDDEGSDKLLKAAAFMLERSNRNTTMIDFDDMIYMPLVHKMTTRFGKDHIFLDEAQDLSRTRQVLMRKFIKPRYGRVHIIGDDRQAIYGFSGADANALNNLIEDLYCTEFPLNVTWRCPKKVVDVAKFIVPDFQAAPEAPDGQINSINLAGKAELPNFLPTDAILCRNNKPLVQMAFRMLRNRVACKVEGRAIGDSMITLCRRWKIKNIAPFLTKLEGHREREIGKLKAKRRENKIDELNDKLDAVKEVAMHVQHEGKTLVADVINFIQSLFGDEVKDVVTLCSYHRSKGREWQNVYLLNHHQLSPAKSARQDWQILQEENLAYVAITRAQSTLTYLDVPE